MGELFDTEPLFPGDNEIQTLYLIQKVFLNLASLTIATVVGQADK